MPKHKKIWCFLLAVCLMQTALLSVYAQEEQDQIVYGQVNEDDEIDSADALLILQKTVDLIELTPKQSAAADVNGDNKVDAGDALCILQYTVDLISVFPVQKLPLRPEAGLYHGIDVSTHQKEIDWAAVKESGVEFAMIRTGFGREEPEQIDAYFKTNVEGAKAQGIPVGCYHYSYATSVENAVKEAEFMLSIIEGYQFEYPVVFDLEDQITQQLGKEVITDIAIAFTDTIRQAGYYPALYANLNWVRNYLDMERLEGVDLWLAQWEVEEPTYDGPYTMWQYTSSGSVPGINGRVDQNICYVNYPKFMQENHYNGY